MPPMPVRFPSVARDFSSRVNFQCKLSHVVHTSPCTIACIYIRAHIKDAIVYVRVQWVTETPKMHCKLGSVALSQLAFLRERQPEFPMRESHRDNTVVKIKNKN